MLRGGLLGVGHWVVSEWSELNDRGGGVWRRTRRVI
jgi:hypothetical protein